MTSTSAIIGFGFAVPSQVRTNDDPIFDWIKANEPKYSDDFTGFNERRILASGESLATIMSEAAHGALEDAGVAAADIDLLLGLGSVGDFISPNTLVQSHYDLKLSDSCHVVPLASEFTAFNDALVLADAMLRGRGMRKALVICGCDWSRHVSYHEATCIGAADGAGAALLSLSDDPSKFKVVDVVTRTDTSFFGAMRMAARELAFEEPAAPYSPKIFTTPLMYFGAEAEQAFKAFGGKVPPQLVQALLTRHKLKASDICLIAHQASSVLTTAWLDQIKPGQFLTTLPQYANMTVASVSVTLAKSIDTIDKKHIVLLTLGMQQQASALLLSRS